jgi:hypothetical protein
VGTGGRLQPVGSGPELIKDRLLYQDGGDYRCVVGRESPEFDEWRTELDVHLVVTGK